jgi:hypothetical protein
VDVKATFTEFLRRPDAKMTTVRAFQSQFNDVDMGRGLHSFTSQLNMTTSYGIGGARRDCVARVKGVLGGV